MNILLKSQYILKVASSKDRLALSTSPTKIYTGPYINTIYGMKISGTSRENLGPSLIPLQTPVNKKGQSYIFYDTLKPEMRRQSRRRNPRPGHPNPTNSFIFTRYFFLDSRTKFFIESNKNEISNLELIDTNIFIPFFINWHTHPEWGMGKNTKVVNFLRKQGIIKISPGDFIKSPIYSDNDESHATPGDLEDIPET